MRSGAILEFVWGMRKLVLSDIKSMNLTMEDCSEILQNLSERFYSGEQIDLNLLELEEI